MQSLMQKEYSKYNLVHNNGVSEKYGYYPLKKVKRQYNPKCVAGEVQALCCIHEQQINMPDKK